MGSNILSLISFGKTKTFVGTKIQIWSYSFDSVGYGSKNQMFDALQWGKWQAGHTRAK